MVILGSVFTPFVNAQSEQPLHKNCVVRFATQEEGAQVLSREDAFTRSLSRFDLQSRLKTTRDVSADALTRLAAGQVRAWTPEEIAAISSTIRSLRTRLESYPSLFPDTVLLIKTTGEEEAGAAYCRQNAIVLPEPMAVRSAEFLERLLAHELFHILSRHNLERQKQLYAVVGFRPCTEIDLPASLRDRKITNPDAPHLDYFIELRTQDGVIPATPILFSLSDSFDPASDRTFFQYMQFRLLQLETNHRELRPALDQEGNAILIDPQKSPSYFDQIGRNTGYIIHPEEVLADNFAHLVLGANSLSTPHIVDDMRRVLMEPFPRRVAAP